MHDAEQMYEISWLCADANGPGERHDIFYGLLPRTDGGLAVDPNTDIPVTGKFSNSHPDESDCLNQHLEKPKGFRIHFFP